MSGRTLRRPGQSGGQSRYPAWQQLYCTIKLKLVLFVVEPLTALTFTVYVPVGVPGLGGGPWLPPPLQPGATTISPNSSKTKSPRRRRCLGNPTRTIEKISPAPEIHRVKKDCAKK